MAQNKIRKSKALTKELEELEAIAADQGLTIAEYLVQEAKKLKDATNS